ncbi:hypothetical protein [Acidisarcina polymorpha]|uniref:hypothetical protein n=1 Tax=Acidisarcina polymorpha TaxID=2211140 RepID=UPI001F32ED1E|nr:hypothetical protein [Acidisarcina polymorpha]
MGSFGVWLAVVAFYAGSTLAQNGDQDAIEKANAQKARATIAAMVQALGGDRWLTLKDETFEGRTSGFYQGKPTGAIGDYFDLRRFPDRERVELGKKRDVVEFFLGDAGWEVTYRGKKALPQDQIDEVLRRRDHSVETAIRVWLKDPKTIVIYDKQSLVERHLADQVTLISSTNDSITIEMDAQTHLPLRRTFQWRDPVYKDKNQEAEEYDDYHLFDGIPTPVTVTRFHNGDMTNQRYLYKAAYNTNLPDSMFDVDATAAKIKK